MLVWASGLFLILFGKVLFKNMTKERERRRFLWWSGLILVFIMGSRYATVDGRHDLNNYYRMFAYINERWMSITQTKIEIGYLFFNKILHSIVPWNQAILYAEAVICIGALFYYIYRNSADPFLSVLTYVAGGLMIFELTGFRQAIAMSIGIYAIECAKQRKLIPFLILVLFASLFHKTALALIVVYPCIVWKTKSAGDLFKWIAALLLFFAISDRLLAIGSELTSNDYTENMFKGNLIGPAINITFYLIPILYYICYEKNDLNVNVLLMGLLVYLLRFVSLPFERISFYFLHSTVIALPRVIRDASKYSRNPRLIRLLFCVMMIALFIYRVQSTIGVEYRFFWG